ncbi:thiamin biosynthesis protein [Cellulomonas chitinilytica]|uniref:Thiamin biosynthesis protein n=1 Tax=Cellulomonas chitinilytica TaxID=398759 RepID=A0A919NXB2_9CELL|nr:thiamine biosynthesis protein ThiF [Cellulomonas chitinilytica]GIG19308.1 thiamin biosynthesis protein [Cellulomonas chitinilytica]
MRLRPGLRVLRRGDTEVQVGTDPRWAVRLTDLTAAECRLLLSVDERTDLAGLPALARGRGLDPARVATLVSLLHEARLTVAGPAGRAAPGPATPDAVTWSLLRPHADGAELVQGRARCTVGVLGLGPTGLGVAVALAAAGIGTLLLDDARPVRSEDVGPGGYRWGDVGSVREQVATRVLRDVAPHLRLDGTQEPDVLVLVERAAADPARAPVLLSAATPHLSVVVREADAVVGPLVVPGDGPCLRCLDLHRTDVDPAWPLLVAQLLGAPAAASSGPVGEVGTVSGVCAALAAAAVVGHLDGTSSHLRGVTFEVGLPDVVPRRRTWAVHPDCGCTALPAVPAGV